MFLQENIPKTINLPSSSPVIRTEVTDGHRFGGNSSKESDGSFGNSSKNTASERQISSRFENPTVVISSSERRIEIVTSSDDDISEKSDNDEIETLPDLSIERERRKTEEIISNTCSSNSKVIETYSKFIKNTSEFS